MMESARAHSLAATRAAAAGVFVGPASGTNFTARPQFEDGRLALLVFFDFVSTARNALGRAAASQRKYAVIAFRVANVPQLQRSKHYIFPLAIASNNTVAAVGIDRIISSLQGDLEMASKGLLLAECLRARAL
jgi:hypothetical protein